MWDITKSFQSSQQCLLQLKFRMKDKVSCFGVKKQQERGRLHRLQMQHWRSVSTSKMLCCWWFAKNDLKTICTSSCHLCKCFILHHRRLPLHYPLETPLHLHSSQTRLFLNSTYIWSAPWILPSQCQRVSEKENGRGTDLSEWSATQHNISHLTLCVGLHDFEKISNCDHLGWHCICDVISDIRGNYHLREDSHFYWKILKWSWCDFCRDLYQTDVF